MSDIRVRFAPSPTGSLHVGGARTALFNFLFAKKAGGKFLLRIEDTDRERSKDEHVRDIIEGLQYIGVFPFDEEPVFQSSRLGEHLTAAEKLLAEGKAYRCFCPLDKLEAERREALSATGDYKYPGFCRNLSEEASSRRAEAGEKCALRFKLAGDYVEYLDGVHGNIRVDCSEMDDFIIVRNDGTPTYMLSVVVDDRDMGITHVIRGDDHISNTPKQILLHQALGNRPPEFAHLPLILGKDRKRLSKRHGAKSALEYRSAGILGGALRNHLALLGWSPGDDSEVFITVDELIEAFSLDRVSAASAVFDYEKLEWLNGIHISSMDTGALKAEALDWLRRYGGDLPYEIEDDEYFQRALNLAKTRMKKIPDIFTVNAYYFSDPSEYDEKGVKKHFTHDWFPERMRALAADLRELEVFSAEAVESVVRGRAEEWGLSAGKLIHPLRLALTGYTASPGLFELVEVLGRERVARRIDKAVDFIFNHHSMDSLRESSRYEE